MRSSPPLDLEGFFHHYQSELVARLGRIVGCGETAADLAQETYLRFMRTSHTEEISHPLAYLHRIATNLAFDHLRKEKYRMPLQASMDEAIVVPSGSPAATDEIYGKQRLAAFQTAFRALHPAAQKVLLLRRFMAIPTSRLLRNLG